MKKLTIIGLVLFTLLSIIASSFVNSTTKLPVPNQDSLLRRAPDCIKMYYYIRAYADTFNIPHQYAFGVAYVETHYSGPLDSTYNPRQCSRCGALGPMQIMPATARLIEGKSVSNKKLKNDVEYNVKLSMRLLRILYDKYGNWKLVFGAYNTGKPIVNNYALKVFNYDIPWSSEEAKSAAEVYDASTYIGSVQTPN